MYRSEYVRFSSGLPDHNLDAITTIFEQEADFTQFSLLARDIELADVDEAINFFDRRFDEGANSSFATGSFVPVLRLINGGKQ